MSDAEKYLELCRTTKEKIRKIRLDMRKYFVLDSSVVTASNIHRGEIGIGSLIKALEEGLHKEGNV